jgi:predicted DNA-binding protein YlxM (UPF0122 family)
MKSEIKNDVTAIYDKIQKDTVQSLKKYSDGLKAIEKQTKQSWAFTGLKEVLFNPCEFDHEPQVHGRIDHLPRRIY